MSSYHLRKIADRCCGRSERQVVKAAAAASMALTVSSLPRSATQASVAEDAGSLTSKLRLALAATQRPAT